MAGGVAGAIYKFLGIKDDARFPQAVIDAVSCECQAELHRYNKDGADLECIHECGRPRLVAAALLRKQNHTVYECSVRSENQFGSAGPKMADVTKRLPQVA